jgi:hypothetical protein
VLEATELLSADVLCHAANNWINGSLPSSFRRLTKLQQLVLGANFMTGPLPNWLGELRELRELRLGGNLGTGSDGSRGFYGTIPESMGHLAKLQVRMLMRQQQRLAERQAGMIASKTVAAVL